MSNANANPLQVPPSGQRTGVPIIVIGRNEGERLRRCLPSAIVCSSTVVYVDSGSTDGTLDFARSLPCTVVELDPSIPFSPARARNEGFFAAMALAPQAPIVQFVDGDCELIGDWIERGIGILGSRPDVAVVCGNLREIHPEATVYNRLCDLEWQQQPGEIAACGGIILIRSIVFATVHGFRLDVAAGEDLELSYRIRQAGWKILQADAGMARHDAAMIRFSQWWRRARRVGFAYAQVEALHGGGNEHLYVRECGRNLGWALALPVVALCLASLTQGISLLVLLCAYFLLFARIFRYAHRRGWPVRDAFVYARFTVLSKFPGLQGMIEYYWWQLRGRPKAIVEHYYEYKNS